MTHEPCQIDDLTPGLRAAIAQGFAGPFAESSPVGGWREWWDIVHCTPGRRSYRNTIAPLIARGLAERRRDGMCRLTSAGVAMRARIEDVR